VGEQGSFSIISLYSGAGGLDLGFEAAGFETRVAVEMNQDAVRTLRLNRDWPVVDANIHSPAASSQELLRLARLSRGDADVLIGGPPCQPFSKSGYWATGDARRLADPRASTLEAFLRVLEDTLPRVFLIENVPGIVFDRKDEGLTYLRRNVEAINARTGQAYSFAATVLRATDFGVPQDRRRVFIVGHREGRDFQFPQPTHFVETAAEQLELACRTDLLRCPTAWDAIGTLQDDDDPELKLTGKWAELLPSIPEGMNYLYHTDRGDGVRLFGWRRRYWSFLLKLSKRLPSWTIAAQPGPAIGPFHWKNRRLSRLELCRLQTFPENYSIFGTMRSAQLQLGNAVPSALAERLALEIRGQLLDDPSAQHKPCSLVPKLMRPIPAPEDVVSVPAQYQALEGQHDPHPGTGKGFGAVARLGRRIAEL
jgi:DNA (cytosine-5)-methyltransferase 1